jgi:hypothetical protein
VLGKFENDSSRPEFQQRSANIKSILHPDALQIQAE